MTLVQKEVKNIYIGEYTGPLPNIGPCPTGFHVPDSSESIAFVEMLRAIGLNNESPYLEEYFFLPAAGKLHPTQGTIDSQGDFWYRTCKGEGGDGGAEVIFNSFDSFTDKAAGLPIRPFKDTPVAPDNSWTQLYDGEGDSGIAGSGVYYNSTLGLISASSDATTWITIADKNLGATVVYNEEDVWSASNCGNYYQRGNNYPFPRSGAGLTTSTRVDASGYGPDNPYSSDEFIFGQASGLMGYKDWSSVVNDNLWGGESV